MPKAFSLLMLLCMTLGCASDKTVVELKGTPGAQVQGYYIRSGHRVDINDKLPLTIQPPGLTLVMVKKMNSADDLRAEAHNEHGMISMACPAGKAGGLRLETADGFSGGVIDPTESLDGRNNAIMTIAPYWHNGTWVFDDKAAGLAQEPFVAGVPEIIDLMVKDIPNARSGFRMTFSANEFPDFQAKLTWVRAESGGNVYRLEKNGMEGWLCPALFRYFPNAPRTIYARADAIK